MRTAVSLGFGRVEAVSGLVLVASALVMLVFGCMFNVTGCEEEVGASVMMVWPEDRIKLVLAFLELVDEVGVDDEEGGRLTATPLVVVVDEAMG